jgi:type VI secretion system protein ImpL
MLAEFVRKDSGRIERFLTTELNGVLHKEGSQWVPDKVNSQGLSFNPAFLRAINQLSQLSDILFTDGSQGISFELQARPVPQVVETQLTIDGQKLHYFNQMADWQSFRWPGETYKPGTMLTWTTVNAGARLFGDYSGTWGFIRWLDQGKRQQLDRSQWMMSFTAPDGRTLQWVLRSQRKRAAGAAGSARFHAAGSDIQRRQRGHGSGADGNSDMDGANNEHSAESGCRLSGGRNLLRNRRRHARKAGIPGLPRSAMPVRPGRPGI